MNEEDKKEREGVPPAPVKGLDLTPVTAPSEIPDISSITGDNIGNDAPSPGVSPPPAAPVPPANMPAAVKQGSPAAPPAIPAMSNAVGNPSTPSGSPVPPPSPQPSVPPTSTFIPKSEGAMVIEIQRLQEVNAALERELSEKRALVATYEENFKEFKEHITDIDNLLTSKDNEIEQLRGTMELLQGELKNKENALLRSKAKIDVLEETLAKAKREILSMRREIEDLAKDKDALEKEKDELLEEIVNLKQDIERIQEETAKSIEDAKQEVERARQEKFDINERLEKKIDEVDALKSQLEEKDRVLLRLRMDISNLEKKLEELENVEEEVVDKKKGTHLLRGRDEIFSTINELLDEVYHNVMIVVPSIQDLVNVDLAKIKPTAKVRIACDVDNSSQEDLDLYQALTEAGNIEIRVFDRKDRFGMNVERGWVLMGFNSKEEPHALLTDDVDAIDLFLNKIIVECWTLARRM